MKRYSASAYLIAAILTLILSAAYSVQAWPLFIKLFVPFPKLEAAVVYEGTLHIEGKARRTKFGEVAPTYFIVGADGTHKVFWGFPGSEKERFIGDEQRFEGITAKVWFHPIFGVIQDEFSMPPALVARYSTLKNRADFGNNAKFGWNYAVGPYDAFEHHFNYEKYRWKLLPSLVGLMLAIYYFIRYRKAKQPISESMSISQVLSGLSDEGLRQTVNPVFDGGEKAAEEYIAEQNALKNATPLTEDELAQQAMLQLDEKQRGQEVPTLRI